MARCVERLGTLLQVQGSDHIRSVSRGPQETVMGTGKLMLKGEHKMESGLLLQLLLGLGAGGSSFKGTWYNSVCDMGCGIFKVSWNKS